VAEVGLDQARAHFQQFRYQSRFRHLVGVRVRFAVDDDAEQFGDRVADRVLADGHDQFAVAVDQLFKSGLAVDQVNVFHVTSATSSVI
jgi:hypothetical protein